MEIKAFTLGEARMLKGKQRNILLVIESIIFERIGLILAHRGIYHFVIEDILSH